MYISVYFFWFASLSFFLSFVIIVSKFPCTLRCLLIILPLYRSDSFAYLVLPFPWEIWNLISKVQDTYLVVLCAPLPGCCIINRSFSPQVVIISASPINCSLLNRIRSTATVSLIAPLASENWNSQHDLLPARVMERMISDESPTENNYKSWIEYKGQLLESTEEQLRQPGPQRGQDLEDTESTLKCA